MSPGALDEKVVRRHLAALRRAVAELERHRGYGDGLAEQWIVERGLQLCAQNVVDLATHLAAARGHDVPDYASAIDELGRLGILPAPFAAEIRGLAGFRNVLVHGYLETDPALVRRFLEQRLGDFERFARYVEDYVDASRRLPAEP